jgi:tetratricopeptide (TPR) repeat protein
VFGNAAQRELLKVYGLFASEYAYRPVDLAEVPYGEFARAFARGRTKRLLLNHGALQCLERLLGLLHPQGFILINDYGQTSLEAADEFEHQRFSLTTAVGLNFPLLKAYFSASGRQRWAEPRTDYGHIYSRLLGHAPAQETLVQFARSFDKSAFEHEQEPAGAARACVQNGRFELAAAHYRAALGRQPGNWVLLGEVAAFLMHSLGEVKAGIDLAKLALDLNPTCSSELWDTLGEGLYLLGRYAEARQAHRQALRINPNDVRARHGLAWVYTRQKDHRAALAALAEALTLDRTGQYRERLVQKQAEVLDRLLVQHQQDYLLLVNLVSKPASAEERGAGRPGGGGPPEPAGRGGGAAEGNGAAERSR